MIENEHSMFVEDGDPEEEIIEESLIDYLLWLNKRYINNSSYFNSAKDQPR